MLSTTGIPGFEERGLRGDMAIENLNYDVADNHGHVPVMRERMADLLRPQVEAAGDKAVLVDATLGAGGHTRYFLSLIHI